MNVIQGFDIRYLDDTGIFFAGKANVALRAELTRQSMSTAKPHLTQPAEKRTSQTGI